MKKRSYFLLIMILFLVMFAAPYRPAIAGSVEDTYGVGLRAISMGGAFTAVADDYSAAHYNPAGLAQKTGHSQAIEYMYSRPRFKVEKLDGSDLKIYDSQGAVRTDPTSGHWKRSLDLPMPVIGAVTDLNAINKLPVHMSMGLITCFTENLNMTYAIHNVPPDQPHFIRYGDQISTLMTSIGLGAELLPAMLYIGGGAQAQVYGKAMIYQEAETGPNGENLAQSSQSSLFKYDPVAGILITPMAGMIKVGASWRDEQFVELPLRAKAQAAVVDPIPITLNMDLVTDIACYYTPEEYSVGLAFNIGSMLVSLEANKQLWGRYDFSESAKTFYGGSPDFKDTINKRVGVEFKPDENTSLMVGFCMQPTPVPDQSGRITNYLDMDKNIFSLGFSKVIKQKSAKYPVKIGALFQYQMCDDYTVHKNGQDGPTWENQESYTVEGDVYTAGLTMTNTW